MTSSGTRVAAGVRSRRGDRLVLSVAVAGTVFIALGAFWLSFTALTSLAQACGIPVDRAWVWPLIVDGVIVVATVSVVAMTGTDRDRRAARYPWLLLIAGTCVSVLANASHAIVTTDARVPAVLAALVAAVPPVVLVAITHLTVELTDHPTAKRVAPPAKKSVDTSASPVGGVDRVREPAPVSPGSSGSVGEALRLRADTSLTNRQIAQRLGVHPSTVGRWLKAHPPTSTSSSGLDHQLPVSARPLALASGGHGERQQTPERSPR